MVQPVVKSQAVPSKSISVPLKPVEPAATREVPAKPLIKNVPTKINKVVIPKEKVVSRPQLKRQPAVKPRVIPSKPIPVPLKPVEPAVIKEVPEKLLIKKISTEINKVVTAKEQPASRPQRQFEPQPTTSSAPTSPTSNTQSAREKASIESVGVPPPVVLELTTDIEAGKNSDLAQGRLEASRNRYLAMLKKRIEQHKEYPLMSRRGRQQGTVIVQFELTSGGNVKSCQVKKSCGYRLLDRAAIRAVTAAAPFPALPEEIDLEDTRFVLPIKFVLSR